MGRKDVKRFDWRRQGPITREITAFSSPASKLSDADKGAARSRIDVRERFFLWGRFSSVHIQEHVLGKYHDTWFELVAALYNSDWSNPRAYRVARV